MRKDTQYGRVLLHQHFLGSNNRTDDRLTPTLLISNNFYTVQDRKRVDSIDLETQ